MSHTDLPSHDRISWQEPAVAFVGELARYNRLARAYPAAHPVVSAAAEKVLKQLSPLTEHGEKFHLGVARHAFMVGKEFLEKQNAALGGYAASLSGLGIITLTFSGKLQPAELYRFSLIAVRPRDEVWDGGGIKQAFAAAGITHIEVQGLDPSLFALSEEMPTISELEREGLLERLLSGLLNGDFPAPREKLARMLADNPAELADTLNALMTDLSDSLRLATLQAVAVIFTELSHEGEFFESGEGSLRKLVTFVANLSPELRRDFLSTFLMTLREDSVFGEQFFDLLPDEMVIEALNTVIAHRTEVPQLVLKLMHRLALAVADSGAPPGSPPPTELGKKMQVLFRKDEFERYVPAAYQQVLAAIITNDRLAGADEAELERLSVTLERDRLEGAIAGVIAEIMKILPPAERGEGIQRNLGELAPFFLKSGDFGSLAKTCGMLKRVQVGGDPVTPAEEPDHPVFTPQFVREVLDAAALHGRERHPEIRDVIIAVGRPFLAPLLELLAEEKNRSLRRFYFDCLHDLGEMVRNAALERLRDDRWFVVRNLLVLLRAFPDHEVQSMVRRFIDHPHPKVCNEALKSAILSRDPLAERHLLQELKSDDVERRMAAVQLAELAHGQAIIDMLLALLDTGGFGDYHLELKQAVVTALAAIGDIRALPRLERLLRSRSLFHPAKHGQLKLAIINSLAHYPAAAGRSLTEEIAAGGGKIAGKHRGDHEPGGAEIK